MSMYESIILTMLETLSILNMWSKLDNRVEKQLIKKVLISIIISLSVISLQYFDYSNGFIIIYIELTLLSLILFEIPKKYIIFESILVTSMTLIIQGIITYLIIMVKNNLEYSLIPGLIVMIILFILSIVIKKFVPINRLLIIYKRNIKTINNLAVLIIVPSVVFMFLFNISNKENFIKLKSFILYLIILMSLGIYIIYNKIKLNQKEEYLKIQRSYNNILKELVSELRKIQHDHKNHLTTILSMTDNYEIKKYIESIVGKTKIIDKSLNIKNPVLNAIIYNKVAMANLNNIEFSIDFKEEIPDYEIEDYELVEILGNLLDNAIEANLELKINNKKIIITLGIENNKKIIEVKNTTNLDKLPSIEDIFSEGYSTKKGKLRGYGLNNVKDIIKKYKGNLEFSIEDNLVTVKILF